MSAGDAGRGDERSEQLLDAGHTIQELTRESSVEDLRQGPPSDRELAEDMMDSFAEKMRAYRDVVNSDAAEAYRGLMQYFRDLKNHLAGEHSELAPGAIHVGAMDVSYIPLLPDTLRQRKLKALLIFFHPSFRFEIWLSGVNKTVQSDWWAIFKEHEFQTYQLADDPADDHQFVRHTLQPEPDFDELDELTGQLCHGASRFVSDIEAFLQGVSASSTSNPPKAATTYDSSTK